MYIPSHALWFCGGMVAGTFLLIIILGILSAYAERLKRDAQEEEEG